MEQIYARGVEEEDRGGGGGSRRSSARWCWSCWAVAAAPTIIAWPHTAILGSICLTLLLVVVAVASGALLPLLPSLCLLLLPSSTLSIALFIYSFSISVGVLLFAPALFAILFAGLRCCWALYAASAASSASDLFFFLQLWLTSPPEMSCRCCSSCTLLATLSLIHALMTKWQRGRKGERDGYRREGVHQGERECLHRQRQQQIIKHNWKTAGFGAASGDVRGKRIRCTPSSQLATEADRRVEGSEASKAGKLAECSAQMCSSVREEDQAVWCRRRRKKKKKPPGKRYFCLFPLTHSLYSRRTSQWKWRSGKREEESAAKESVGSTHWSYRPSDSQSAMTIGLRMSQWHNGNLSLEEKSLLSFSSFCSGYTVPGAQCHPRKWKRQTVPDDLRNIPLAKSSGGSSSGKDECFCFCVHFFYFFSISRSCSYF